jgi:serine/threonine protein kinase
MPPEQIAGEAKLTGATDLYAVGCILYEMVVGRPPFDGSTIVDVFDAHLNDVPEPPADAVRDCPADLSDLVMQLLEKSVADRPGDAQAVQSALADILHGRPMRLEPRPTAELEADLAATIHPDRPNLTKRLQTSHATGAGRWGWKIVVIGGLVVIGLVVAALAITLG